MYFNPCFSISSPLFLLFTSPMFAVVVVALIVSSATRTLIVEVPGVFVVRSRLAHTAGQEQQESKDWR